MYEHRHEPLISPIAFLWRLLRSLALATALVAISLGIGMAGYHYIAHLSWVDALLNASMILTGMGPVDPMQTVGQKLFASFYALFSGVAFLTMVAVAFAPVIHRFLHRFHLELAEDQPEAGSGAKRSPARAGRKSVAP